MASSIDLEEIYQEYQKIIKLFPPSELKCIEKENLFQIEVSCPYNEISILLELISCKYFDVLVMGTSHSLKYFFKEDRKSLKDNARNSLKEKVLRIRYEKNEIVDAVNNLDYFFFSHRSACRVIFNLGYNPSEYKLNIGVYNIDSFETYVLNFIAIKNVNDTIVQKKAIDSNIIAKIKSFLNYSEGKFDFFNNIYTFMPITSINNSIDLHKIILKNFYQTFYKFISYKNDNNIFNIRGKKSVKIDLSGDIESDNYKYYNDIVNFLFSDDKFLEKFIIVKNVFTRYASDNESFTSLDSKIIEINKTIKHYFEKYVQNDLDDFFKNRDTVYKEAIAMSKLINEQNDKIVAYINTTLISILALGITFTYKNITDYNLNLLIISDIILLFFSFMFYRIINKNSIDRSNSIEEQFDMFLDKMGIILEEEKKEIRKIYISNPKSNLMEGLKKIKSLLIFANAFLFIFILFSIFDIVEII